MEMWLTRDEVSWDLHSEQPKWFPDDAGSFWWSSDRCKVAPANQDEVCGIPLEVGGICRVRMNLRYLMEGEKA